MTPEQILEAVRETIRGLEYCFLITLGADGQPHARLMQHYEPDEDLAIWFGTSPMTRKVRDIEHNRRVLVTFQRDAENAYVVLEGEAMPENDLTLRQTYWREFWVAFFPGGPTGENYLLIRFVPDRIEIMNFERHVAPEPYGIRPAVLVRRGTGWVLENAAGG